MPLGDIHYFCIVFFNKLLMELIAVAHYTSPVGEMVLGSYKGEICMCDWVAGKKHLSNAGRVSTYIGAEFVNRRTEIIEETVMELDEYFSGERKEFSIPIHFSGTEFQCCVWSELTAIPYGEVISYSELARRIGNPSAVRAVAAANAVNAISVLVPCHRVIGVDRSLTGYGGGLEAKRYLLELEAVNRA